jgi:LysM repeat protein
LPQSAINTVEKVGEAIAPGSIVKSSSSATLYLVDDLTNKIKLASSAQATSVSKSRTFTISSKELAGLQTRTGFTSGKVQCNGDVYLLDRGVLYPTSPGAAAEFPGSVYPLSTITCAAMELSTRSVGQFIRSNSGILYLIQDGTKQRISSWAHLAKLRGDGPGYIQATNYFASRIPTAGTAPATVQLASLEGIPTGDFGELSFVGTVPEVIQADPEPAPANTPEPEPTPAPDLTPEPVATVIEYRVQSGDTLLRIASKFGISSSALQSFNSISNPNRISIGQLLKIPTSTDNTNVAQAQDPEEPAAQKTYTVVSGDSIWGISRKLGVSSAALTSLNGINNANFIRVGQVLKVPSS